MSLILFIIKWLKAHHLSHAAIVLLGMWPMSLITSTPWDAALVWVCIYYSREVSVIQWKVGALKAFWPGNWLSDHDRIQTIYLIVAAISAALFLTNII
ncbi:MAG: hypothetical protein COB49_00445 [Alphaproteobacteria bacterium]|nr:MAG: hypothetical protein COB49_00445 [Alphaproteobacteria bacterium]